MSKWLMYSSTHIVNDHQTGGTKRFIELTSHLQKKIGADLCTADDEAALKPLGLKAEYHMEDVEKVIFSPEVSIAWKNRKVIFAIKKQNYDHVVAFDVPPALGLCLAGMKHITIMIRKDLLGYERVTVAKNNLKTKLKRLALGISEYFCLKKAEQVVCQCDYDKNALIERHPTLRKQLEKKILVQINNVNPSWIVEKSRLAVQQDSASNIEHKTLCFIGGFNDKRKGHDIFLPAIVNLLKSGMNVSAYVIGGGRDLDAYREQYSPYKDNICFVGRCENPIRYILSSEITVVPSLADSCPNTVMEAMMNDRLVLGSNVGGIPDILKNENVLFELTRDSLEKKLREYLANDRLCQMMLDKQIQRKEELTFEWAKKIEGLIGKDNTIEGIKTNKRKADVYEHSVK